MEGASYLSRKGKVWVSLFIDRNFDVYFNSFGIQYIPEDVLNKVKDESTTHNIFRIQNDDSIICRFYCIAFIEYMIGGKTLLDNNDLFSPNECKKTFVSLIIISVGVLVCKFCSRNKYTCNNFRNYKVWVSYQEKEKKYYKIAFPANATLNRNEFVPYILNMNKVIKTIWI